MRNETLHGQHPARDASIRPTGGRPDAGCADDPPGYASAVTHSPLPRFVLDCCMTRSGMLRGPHPAKCVD
eukprot:364389-Chlamydomonas_euryale.AAC.11